MYRQKLFATIGGVVGARSPYGRTIAGGRRRLRLIETSGCVRTKLVQLRLSPELITRIDRTRGAERVPPSRHHWILEAIHEKLEREETP